MAAGDRVVLGRILGAFGVQGWLKVKPFTESFDGLIEQPLWTLSSRGVERTVTIEEWKPHGAALLAKVEGIDDRTEADALRGADVTVPRDKLPAAGAGEYYWNDLVGLAVRNVRGEELGTVSGLIAAPAHDVLRVRSAQRGIDGAEGEQLIPFVEPIVKAVDIAGGSVTVDWEADY